MYKQKYLIYKKKYLNLKHIIQHGGGTIYIQNDDLIKLDNVDNNFIRSIMFLKPDDSFFIPLNEKLYEIRAITLPKTSPLKYYQIYINDKSDNKIYKYTVHEPRYVHDLYTINIMDSSSSSFIMSLKISDTDLEAIEMLKEGEEHNIFINSNHYIITKNKKDNYNITSDISDTYNKLLKSKIYFFTLRNVRRDHFRNKFQEESKEPEIERESKSMN